MATPTTFTPKNVDAAQLGSSLSTLLTVPSNTNGILITGLTLVNDTTTTVTASIHLVPNGGSADDTNIICKTISIPASGVPVSVIGNHPQALVSPQFLEANGLIRGVASVANQVTCHISYIEFD